MLAVAGGMTFGRHAAGEGAPRRPGALDGEDGEGARGELIGEGASVGEGARGLSYQVEEGFVCSEDEEGVHPQVFEAAEPPDPHRQEADGGDGGQGRQVVETPL